MLYGAISLLAALALAGIDQIIKFWAVANLQPVGTMPLIPGILELRFVLNDGMAFSLLSGQRWLLIGATSVMLIALLVLLFRRDLSLPERIAWVLVVGGGIGNLIDRVQTGVVVDYLNVLFMEFAVFNFADICVCVGIGLVILLLVLEMIREHKAAKEKASSPDHGTA